MILVSIVWNCFGAGDLASVDCVSADISLQQTYLPNSSCNFRWNLATEVNTPVN